MQFLKNVGLNAKFGVVNMYNGSLGIISLAVFSVNFLNLNFPQIYHCLHFSQLWNMIWVCNRLSITTKVKLLRNRTSQLSDPNGQDSGERNSFHRFLRF